AAARAGFRAGRARRSRTAWPPCAVPLMGHFAAGVATVQTLYGMVAGVGAAIVILGGGYTRSGRADEMSGVCQGATPERGAAVRDPKGESMLAENWGTGEVFLSFIWFMLFFIWIWLLIMVFSDIFRSHDLGGWGKALWVIFVIIVPYLGVFVY